MKKSSNIDKLAAIRDKLKKTDMASGGGGFWSAPVGKSVIRILPEVGDMEAFFQPVGRHNLTADGKKMIYCPEFTSEGELPCPVCELVDELYKAGDVASKKLAKQLGRRRSFWMNIIIRGSEGKGPQIFTPGVQVMGELAAIIEDPDYGLIYDPDTGFDITVERTGTGLETEYSVRARRNPSPLSSESSEIEDWLSKARDVSYVELTDDPEEDKDVASGHAVWVLPYDRINREYDLESTDELAEDDDDDVEPAPKKKAAKKPVVEEVDDDEEDDDEEDEEAEDVPAAKQEVTRRKMARRSTRR